MPDENRHVFLRAAKSVGEYAHPTRSFSRQIIMRITKLQYTRHGPLRRLWKKFQASLPSDRAEYWRKREDKRQSEVWRHPWMEEKMG
jgi:hypothetical protein